MDVGTGKIRPEEMRGIPHYCLDLADPSEDFSVARFVKEAEAAVADISARGKTVVVCGGTGLYLDALLFDFDVPEVPPDWEFRDELEKYRLTNGNEALWKRLEAVDPAYAAELHPNNHRYVVRALEVFEKTGKSKAAFHGDRRLKFENVEFVTPYGGDREALYAKIGERVERMFEDGLVEEVRTLSEKYGTGAFGMQTIGYAETVRHLAGELSYAECVELVKKNTRNYAKRQITWNRRYENLASSVDF